MYILKLIQYTGIWLLHWKNVEITLYLSPKWIVCYTLFFSLFFSCRRKHTYTYAHEYGRARIRSCHLKTIVNWMNSLCPTVWHWADDCVSQNQKLKICTQSNKSSPYVCTKCLHYWLNSQSLRIFVWKRSKKLNKSHVFIQYIYKYIHKMYIRSTHVSSRM